MTAVRLYKFITEKYRSNEHISEAMVHCSYVFWFGDLNFRVDSFSKEEIESHVKERKFEPLLKKDQVYIFTACYFYFLYILVVFWDLTYTVRENSGKVTAYKYITCRS